MAYINFKSMTHFTPEQNEEIISRVVPLVAAPADHAFFRGVLHVAAQDMNKVQFAQFIESVLKKAAESEEAA